ncbi:dual 3',5'-cyclic-AMP and -GMP phosphodiesterase 11 [Trichonephila clavipes]|nr:dual 3',5'-cyclic-AMP and -GMP phosphodiesterase 11 [Trichonephila clavipes]
MFKKCILPSTHVYRLQDLRFNDFSLDDEDMLKACLRMFVDLDLIERFHIKYDVLCRWLLSVRKNYRQVTYHNWRHAFNVGQMMFAVLTITKLWRVFGEVETLSLLIACLCHDLDHRGTNNSFQIKSCSPLAQLYSTSTMEHHHFDQCIMILNSEGNQILSHLSPDDYSTVVHVLEDAILATDLAVYFRRRGTFFHMVETGNYNWRREDNRELLRAMLMTVCDIAAITKPWEIQKVVAKLVASEFFQQGDIEKEQLKIQPIDMMNRDKQDELPMMQVRFIDSICAPVYEAFAKISDKLKPLVDGVRQNRAECCQVIYSRFGLAIHQNDHQARRRFVEWAQNEIAVVPDFHKRILFSDEAHFWLNGYVNKQNCRIWSEANLQVYVETPLHPEKLTVWCALWAGGILLQKR